MSEYSLINHIRNIRNAYLQTVAELVNYEWDYEFRNEQITRLKERVLLEDSKIKKENWDAHMSNLDAESVRELLSVARAQQMMTANRCPRLYCWLRSGCS